METFLLRMHQKQISHQCFAAFLALDIAQQGLAQNNQTVFWASVQNFLTAAANVSKTLWGQGGKLTEQRTALRSSLNVPDDSPLVKSDLRNHLEHFDERLDYWFANSQRRNHVDFLIGPAEGSISGIEPGDIFGTMTRTLAT